MNLSNLMHPIQGHECLSACIGNIFNIEYPQISGNEIIIGGDGFLITYETNNKIIGSPMYEANYRFLDKNKICYKHDKLLSEHEATLFLEEELQSDDYLIIKVDAKQLSYDRVFAQATDSPHFINICGAKGEDLIICDGYVPARNSMVYEGTVSRADVMNAWKGMSFEYVLFEQYPKLDVGSVVKDIDLKLWESIRRYYQGGTENNIYYGKDAIAKMFADCKECTDVSRVYEVNYQLRIYGFLSTKEIVCSLLQRKEKHQKNAQEYVQIIQEWDRICMAFLKAFFSKKAELFDQLLDRVNKCIEAEEALFKEIIRQEEIM